MHGLEILLGLAFKKMHEQEDVDLFLGSVELVLEEYSELTSTEVQFMIKHVLHVGFESRALGAVHPASGRTNSSSMRSMSRRLC